MALWALLAVAARAEGLIVDARPAGLAGPQVDASLLSAQPARRDQASAGWEPYIVRQGDTLSAIAAVAGVDVATLVASNQLASADRLVPGQVLRIGTDAGAQPALRLGDALVRVQFWPWPPAQGQTVAIWLETRRPVTISVTLGGRAYPVHIVGRLAWAMAPIPPLTPPGPLALVISAGSERQQIQAPVQPGAFPSHNIPEATTAAILSQTEEVEAETTRMAALFSAFSPGNWTPRSRFRLPLVGDFPRTAPFGSRRTYGANPAISAHAGEDFSAAPGTPVYAPAAGMVVLAEALLVRGNAVVLDHGNGVYTGYWHLSKLEIAAGQAVKPGDLLGLVGSTGLSTGAHLHWELRVAGMAVDPLQWVAR